jgi:hypothetical protein
MHIISSKLGLMKMVVIALVVIIVVVGVIATYIVLLRHSNSPTLTPTPTSAPIAKTHAVNYTTMIDPGNDYWNITATKPYTVKLNDSMTVSSPNQYLMVTGLSSSITNVWTVLYKNSTDFQFISWDVNGNEVDSGWLSCNNGLVQLIVTNTTITFSGTTSFTSNIPFTNLDEIWTANSDGAFNSGELHITLTIT